MDKHNILRVRTRVLWGPLYPRVGTLLFQAGMLRHIVPRCGEVMVVEGAEEGLSSYCVEGDAEVHE